MNKTQIVISFLFITIIFSFFILQRNNSLFTANKNPAVSSTKDKNPKGTMDILPYTDYSQETLREAQKKGTTVLFFAATTWCQTCSELDEELKQRIQEIPKNITILKVDYDNDKQTNAKYQVVRQHTLIVLDKNGKEVQRWIGGGMDTLLYKLSTI